MQHHVIDVTEPRLFLTPITRCMMALQIPDNLGYIAGGSTKDMLYALNFGVDISKNNPTMAANDVDIYCIKPECFEDMKKHIGERCKLVDDRIMTVNYEYQDTEKTVSVQLIRPFEGFNGVKFCGDHESVINLFDINVCVGAFMFMGTTIMLRFSTEMLSGLQNKRLEFTNIHHPLSALIRASKYISKGFRMELSSYFLIMDNWDEIGKDEKKRLQEIMVTMTDGGESIEIDDYLFMATMVGGLPLPIAEHIANLTPEEREKELAKYRGEGVEDLETNGIATLGIKMEDEDGIPF